jgi:bifunctional oligoribonuclease and PAP phosphatase NrnA
VTGDPATRAPADPSVEPAGRPEPAVEPARRPQPSVEPAGTPQPSVSPAGRRGASAETLASRELVVAEILGAERFLVVTHEHPDGDALGSLVAMQGVLRALGKDSIMFIAANEFPLPQEYRFFGLDGLVTTIPDDLERRTVIFLDCGNIERNPAQLLRDVEPLLNIDHHHDNTRFGTIDHVVPEASCTAEIVWELMHRLGVPLTRTIADALYVGLITDTGRFSYENTRANAHLMAAELIDAGVDVAALYQRIYEGVPYAKLELLRRALQRVARYDDGHLAIAFLTAHDFSEAEAEESYAEGIIDQLRAVEGTKVAALVRELLAEDRRGQKKVSLRATGEDVDVSAIARAHGGGGHRRAAGFTTGLSIPDLVGELRAQLAGQLAGS